jgi:predicted enzyme related to lactoylglutathione lyase
MRKETTSKMTTPMTHPEAFGIATVAADLQAARAFYTKLYPYEVREDSFAGIPFFSVLKGGNTLVTVFERSPGNPIQGTVPVLKVDSVSDYLHQLQSLGASVIIPESVCPCTQTGFALCADREGNQFIVKEAFIPQ